MESFKHWQPSLTIAAGALLYALVTLTSIGAGAIGVVLLAYLYPLRLTPSRLIATDIVHAIPLAMFAGLGHLLIGNVDFTLLGNLLIGSLPGVLIGAMLSSKLPQDLLRNALGIRLCRSRATDHTTRQNAQHFSSAPVGAGGRNRTGTGFTPGDFESPASTNFTTPARERAKPEIMAQ